MKWMKKLKLINWHYFKDEEISFGRQTMITGRNAAGKSTIIDALQVLFIANLKMIRFNSSAHNDAKRSLISYLRGKIGSDEQRYVREGDFTTYLMAEFFDEKQYDYFVVGVVIDVYRDDSIDDEYFIINNCKLEDIDYLGNTGQLKNRDEFHRYVNNLNNRSVLERTKDGYQKALLNRMGQVNHRFFSSFSKALSFKPIHNVRNFVYDYILDKKELQLDIMKENFEVHQRYKRELDDLSVRKIKLNKIKDHFVQYKNLLDTIEQQEYVIRRLRYDKQQEENEKLEYQIQTSTDKITKLTNDKDLAEKQHIEAKDKKVAAFGKWQNNQEKIREEELKKEIEETSKELENSQKQLKKFINDLQQERDMIQDLINISDDQYWKWGNEEQNHLREGSLLIDSIVNILKSSVGKTISHIQKQQLNKLGEELSNLYNRFIIAKSDADKKIKELKDEREKLIKEINDLENKKRTYPSSISKLKELLERELNGKSKVWIFCEEMEVLNEEWRNAIEGYLHTQKFDLLVEPDYFEQALSIYEAEKWSHNIEGVGLVNTQKERKYLGNVKGGSLAKELETTNTVIQARIEHLLGRVMKASSEKELSQHQAAVTNSCMVYQNLVARQMKKERYQIPYIGSKAIPRQLELKKKELLQTEKELKQVESLSGIYNGWKVRLNEKTSYYSRLSNALDLPEFIQTLQESLNQSSIELSQLDLSGIKQLKADFEYWKSRETELETKVRNFFAEIERENNNFVSMQQSMEQYQDELQVLEQQLTEWEAKCSSEMLNMAKDRFKEAEKQDVPLDKKIENWLGNQRGNTTQSENRFVKLRNDRHDYNLKHHFNGEEEATHNDEYQMLLEQIDIDIDSYQEKLNEALKQSEEEFKSHFIYKMKEAIEGAKRQFQQLNDALKRFPFNQESYQFEFKPSEKYKRFYEIIMDPQIVEKGSLFDLPDDAKDQSLHELFEILIKGEIGDQEEFSDYRRYLDFDIIITTTNSRIRFSQVLKEKSGGETQTPFYIAILSSFNQLYSSDKTMRLVVFDEAFNKMDEERIQTSLRLIKDMNFQLIAAVPDEKLSNMATEVSTVIVVHREGYECFADTIHREVSDNDGMDKGTRENQRVQEQTSMFASEEV